MIFKTTKIVDVVVKPSEVYTGPNAKQNIINLIKEGNQIVAFRELEKDESFISAPQGLTVFSNSNSFTPHGPRFIVTKTPQPFELPEWE